MDIEVQLVPLEYRRREEGILKKGMFDFQLRNVITIPCIISI